jgi:hypothetical protein
MKSVIPCLFCRNEENQPDTKAILLAPRWVGGEDGGFVEFVPVCKYHSLDWYDDVSDEKLHIPMVKLTEKFHRKHNCFI